MRLSSFASGSCRDFDQAADLGSEAFKPTTDTIGRETITAMLNLHITTQLQPRAVAERS